MMTRIVAAIVQIAVTFIAICPDGRTASVCELGRDVKFGQIGPQIGQKSGTFSDQFWRGVGPPNGTNL